MPALENPRHERYAQDLAKGTSQIEAYVNAGYKPNRSAAQRLASDVNICGRVSEIQGRAAVRAEITVAAITDRLLRIADIAEETGVEIDPFTGSVLRSSSKHLGIAKGALMDAAKLNGLVIDRAKIDTTLYQPRDRSSFYDDEEG